ncbi:hypothetical protein CERZMDRAFT_115291 [Cercospora zeae-maydis SCOH1-5]|uniref:WKF domain-containing protein n=1 Tax=Cercospora zeae-maydis SCOH1-5 TaxID=717836 RepID=A0A6A6F0L4_9PEZI|nr:hypothetical protein CERZMDRAFT_115291 [Cercospora zeae-maydis SCOH1-5]
MAAQSAKAEAPRVPAWKRLGLKLKYAKDNPAQVDAESNNASTALATETIAPIHKPSPPPVNSQKRTLEPSHNSQPAKRSKIENPKLSSQQKPYPGSAPKTKTAGQQVWEEDERSTLPGPKGVFKAPGQAAKRIVFGDDEEESPQPTQPSAKEPRPTEVRKTVSFTPDTKQEDSFSAQNLFKAWASGEDPAESAAEASTEQPASPLAKAKQPKPKKEKKKTKESADTDISRSAESGDAPNYLKYLEQFTNDKSNWKFNKNRQNDLFKHVFDIDRIPSKYIPSLVEYISTTQGQARIRIAQQAEEILKAIWVGENQDADQMSLGSAAERRLAYYEALQASIARYQNSGAGRTQYGDEQLREIMREHERGKRAEQLLQKALSDEDSTPSSTAATSFSSTLATIPRATRVVEMQKTAPGQYTTTEINLRNPGSGAETKRKRKRKSRTDVSSSSSSESDSSPDDSSDSSSDESDTQKKKKNQKKKPSPPKELPPLFDTAVLDKKERKKKEEEKKKRVTTTKTRAKPKPRNNF